MLKSGILLAILGLILAGCNLRESDKALDLGRSTLEVNSFEFLKTNILDLQCLRCHSSANAKGDVDLSSYGTIMSTPGLVVVGHSSTSTLFTEIESGAMPEDGPALSASDVALIQQWIDSGAPNGDFAQSEPPSQPPPVIPEPPQPTPVASYQDIQIKIMNKSCVSCHSGSKPSGRVDLANYQKLMANTRPVVVQPGAADKSLLYTEITSGSMPPKGMKVDPALVALLKTWINDGAKDN